MIATITSWGMFLGGLLLLIFLLMRRSRRYLRLAQRPSQPTRPRAGRDAGDGLLDAPREVLRWQVAMHETARDLKAELDTKLGLVQALVRQAQQQSERLEAAIHRAEQLGLRAEPDSVAMIAQLADAAEPAALLAALPPVPPASAAAEQIQRIHAFADLGLAPLSIAAQTGVSLGEVELLLSVRTPGSHSPDIGRSSA